MVNFKEYVMCEGTDTNSIIQIMLINFRQLTCLKGKFSIKFFRDIPWQMGPVQSAGQKEGFLMFFLKLIADPFH